MWRETGSPGDGEDFRGWDCGQGLRGEVNQDSNVRLQDQVFGRDLKTNRDMTNGPAWCTCRG